MATATTAVQEQAGELAGEPVFSLFAQPPAGVTPTLYVHGVPSSSEDWRPFLERTGGIAPDLPGFGRSTKRGDLPCTMEFYGQWLRDYLDDREIDRFQLVVHDWGAVGLVLAQAVPERVERLVVMNAVTLLPGYRWHRTARIWRTRFAGEVAMGLTTPWFMRRAYKFDKAAPPDRVAAFANEASQFFDVGTQRSILKLYRSSPPEALAAAGTKLGAITCPSLVVWGERDPYIDAHFADDYAAALGGETEVVRLPDAGHWPWMHRPDAVDTVAAFLAG